MGLKNPTKKNEARTRGKGNGVLKGEGQRGRLMALRKVVGSKCGKETEE